MKIRRIVLDGTYNTRELGGYMGSEEKATKYGRFLRSDDLSRMTKRDIQQITDYGVKTVIDLRNKNETEKAPSPFTEHKGVSFYWHPLTEGMEVETDEHIAKLKLDKLYIDIIENHKYVYELFKTMASTPKGTILYNCTAGKDRTGVVTCLLLMLAGVCIRDITADYEVSSTYLSPLREQLLKKYPEMPQHIMKSQPEWIVGAYNHIGEKYKTVKKYFKYIGLDKNEIGAIKKKII